MLASYQRRGAVERRALRALGVERRALSDAEYDRVEELAELASLGARIDGELDALAAEQRHAVRLRVLEERPYDEVAHELGVSEQTARARVSRALRTLRDSPPSKSWEVSRTMRETPIDPELPILDELGRALYEGALASERRLVEEQPTERQLTERQSTEHKPTERRRARRGRIAHGGSRMRLVFARVLRRRSWCCRCWSFSVGAPWHSLRPGSCALGARCPRRLT